MKIYLNQWWQNSQQCVAVPSKVPCGDANDNRQYDPNQTVHTTIHIELLVGQAMLMWCRWFWRTPKLIIEVKQRAIFHMWKKLINYSLVLKQVWVSFIREAPSKEGLLKHSEAPQPSQKVVILVSLKVCIHVCVKRRNASMIFYCLN